MANITETNDWPAGVYQYAIGDIVDGGPDSLETLPLRQLAHRSLFQRLANVTPWDSVLAGLYGYPAGACVMHSGLSWRAKVANAVEPGTDAAKWERWAFSLDELAAWFANYLPYGAPTACANTGPVLATADKLKIHKSPLGEYWMWLGDAWRVVAGLYSTLVGVDSTPRTAGVTSVICSITVPRSGRLIARGILSQLNQTNSYTYVTAYIKQYRAGAPVGILLNSFSKDFTTLGTEYSQTRPIGVVDVQAGDVLALEGTASQPMFASPSSQSSIHVEYLQ